MATKDIKRDVMITAICLVYGVASGMGYIILGYSDIEDKLHPGSKVLAEKISDAIVSLSGSISDALCHVFGITIQSPALNYQHVIFMVIQVLQYYIFAIAICHAINKKAKNQCPCKINFM